MLLAERLTRAVSSAMDAPNFRMAAGYDAVQNYHDAPIEPSDMLMRASMAMRMSRSETTSGSVLNIRQFDGQLN